MDLVRKYKNLARVREQLKRKGNKKAVKFVNKRMAQIRCEIYNENHIYSLTEYTFQIGDYDL